MRLLLLLLVVMVACAYSHGFVTEEERLTIQKHYAMTKFHQDLEIQALFGVGHYQFSMAGKSFKWIWRAVRGAIPKIVKLAVKTFSGSAETIVKMTKSMEKALRKFTKKLMASSIPDGVAALGGSIIQVSEHFEKDDEKIDVVVRMRWVNSTQGTGVVYRVIAPNNEVLEQGFFPSEDDPLDAILNPDRQFGAFF